MVSHPITKPCVSRMLKGNSAKWPTLPSVFSTGLFKHGTILKINICTNGKWMYQYHCMNDKIFDTKDGGIEYATFQKKINFPKNIV